MKNNNPCCGCCTETKVTCPKKDDSCLRFCNLYYSTPLQPCTGTFSIDVFTGYSHILGDCAATQLSYKLYSVSPGLTGVTLVNNTLTGNLTNVVGEEAIVMIQVTCGKYDNTFNVKFPVIDNCKNVTCTGSCAKCDPCTGQCVQANVTVTEIN